MSPSRLSFTGFHLTINTNYAPTTRHHEQWYQRRLAAFFTETLNDIEVWRPIIAITPSFSAVRQIRLDGIGIETSPDQRRVHAHAEILIEHTGNVNIHHGQREMQNLLNRTMPWLKGSYVVMNMSNTRQHNYATKGGQDNELLSTRGIRPTLIF